MTSFLQAIAFMNANVTSCADNRTTFKKLPTVRATIFVISKIFQKYFKKPEAFEFIFENQIDPETVTAWKSCQKVEGM